MLSFILKKINFKFQGEFDSTESPLVIPDSDSEESVDNSTDLLTAVTASENVNDQLVVKGM